MRNDRGFQPIRRAPEEEEDLLEALARRKGIGRYANPADAGRAGEDRGAGQEATASATPAEPAEDAPTPRARMKAMNLELPDYVMQALKERALREDCSVRHLIMKGLAAQGVEIRPADLVADGRRIRGSRKTG